MLNWLIPWPYRLLAWAALASALLGFGFVRGLLHQQRTDDQAALAQVQVARRVEQKQAAITSQVDAVHATADAAARVVYRTITQEVIRYEQDPGAAVRLDAGWVRDHNAAALGRVSEFSESAGRADAGAGSVTAADALGVVADNYAICNDNARRLSDLQAWIAAQSGLR